MERFFRCSPELKAVMIASKEGLPIVSAFPDGTNEKRVASITATLFSVAEKSIYEMGLGELGDIIIRGSEGNIITLEADPDTLLTASTTRDVRLGLIILDLKRVADKIISNGYGWMGDENLPYPFIFKPPTPPGDLGLSGQAQLKQPAPEEDTWDKPYCKNCGSSISEGQSICHVCGNKVI